jgi:glucose/arabinose dehydrogenase
VHSTPRSTQASTALALLLALSAPSAFAAPSEKESVGRGLRLTPIVRGLDHPVHLTVAPGDSRLFVVEQPGRIRTIENGRVDPEPFLDLTDRVSYHNERGLLSVAFHPRYATNGYLYVDYTDRHGDTRVVRFTARADRRTADPASALEILGVDQPYANHNGGHVLFGPDSMLWITMGDGGSGGDPGNRAQNPHELLGKLLRIDVDHGEPYSIPRDNPFADGREGRPEIWATGLRNPWRIAFDPPSGLLYIADVGQNKWEEVDVCRYSRPRPNFGWRLFEGNHDYRRESKEPTGLVFPLVEYDHGLGCSITGGVVYRGSRIPALRGRYLYSDYCTGWLRSLRVEAGRAVERREWAVPAVDEVTSFGTDADGEVYVISHPGVIYRIDAER